MLTILICMYNLFEIFSSNNVITFVASNLSFSCPKIGQINLRNMELVRKGLLIHFQTLVLECILGEISGLK